MTSIKTSKTMLGLTLLLLLVVPMGRLGAQSKKPSAPAPAPSRPAPAPHASAPAHSSAPARPSSTAGRTPSTPGHTPTTGHTPGTAGRTASTAGAHPSTAGKTAAGGKAAAGGRTTAAGGKATAAGGKGAKPGTTQRSTAGAHPSTAGAHPSLATKTFKDKSGHDASASFRKNGKVASIHANGMTINHGLHGGRTVMASRNGRTVVAMGGRRGYVQRAYLTRNGRAYVQRTYVVGGVAYAGVYRTSYYGGVAYYGYAPAYYYGPAYYGWAYNPWPGPVVYGPAAWGWAGSPWYGYYGGYFNPYPAYATASLWLTDYLISANLQAAYAAQAEANAAATEAPGDAPPLAQAGATQLTPEVKQAIADQVKQQLAADKAAAANPQQAVPGSADVPAALNPAQRTFVVASNLDVTGSNGAECSLTPGDVITRLTDTPDADQNVNASIASSKKADCAAGSTVAVGVQDLQEMHNQFRQTLDAGLKALASNSGKNGLPTAPSTATQAGEVPAPSPDASAASQLQDVQQQADQTEKEVAQQAPAGSGQ